MRDRGGEGNDVEQGQRPDGVRERAQAVPTLLWVVIAAFAAVATYLLGPTITTLRSGSALFAVSPATGALSVVVGLVVGFFSIAVARVGYGLYEGSRVARGLAVALVPTFLVVAVVSELRSVIAVLLALLFLGATALLAAPDTRALFTGPRVQHTEPPTSVVVAQVVVVVASVVVGLLAAVLLVAGFATVAAGDQVDGGGAAGAAMIVSALLASAIAGAGSWARSAIAAGNRAARVVVGVAAVLDLVVVALLAAGDGSLPFLAAFVLHTGVAAALWLAPDARGHVGDAPLPVVEDLHRRALTMTTPVRAMPMAPALRPAPGVEPSSCPRCGQALEPGWRVCPHCGTPAADGHAVGQRA